MTDSEIEASNRLANIVGAMIAFNFLRASESTDFKATAIDGLVNLADRLIHEQQQLAFHIVLGALDRLEYTYLIPDDVSYGQEVKI